MQEEHGGAVQNQDEGHHHLHHPEDLYLDDGEIQSKMLADQVHDEYIRAVHNQEGGSHKPDITRVSSARDPSHLNLSIFGIAHLFQIVKLNLYLYPTS